MRFRIYQDSLTGGRKNNEDRVAYSYSKDALLMAIADGMGGHLKGEVAAQLAVTVITENFQRQARTTLRRPTEFLAESLHAAHRAIADYAADSDLTEAPRTTCVACVVQNDRAYWAHVGDSRLYLFREGQLLSQTRDHSRVQRLLDAGVITAHEALVHPERNRIYNCLGGSVSPRVDVAPETILRHGDMLLLSTDGFWSMAPIPEIENALRLRPPTEALPRLMREALNRGGDEGDNLSIVGMTWEAQGEPATVDTISTLTMPVSAFATEFTSPRDARNESVPDISDEEIEQSIAEIQAAIRRYSR